MKTEDRILNAFNDLIRTTGFEQVTVDMIVQKAGSSRATFYRHFHDKYEVMYYNFVRLIDESMQDAKLRTMEDLFILLLRSGKTVWQSLLPLFHSKAIDSLREFIAVYSFTVAKNLYETGDHHGEKPLLKTMSESQQLQLRIFCAGAAAFFEDWILGKYKVKDKQAASAMYEILPACLKGRLF